MVTCKVYETGTSVVLVLKGNKDIRHMTREMKFMTHTQQGAVY
jgi:hypothetical protein